MKTYISDIIPRLSKFSKKLDDLSLLADQHWVSLDNINQTKRVFIFRRSFELLISTDGKVIKGKWEFIGNQSLLLEFDSSAYLFKHGFFDECVLALKVDSKEEYAIFINESKTDTELNSLDAINGFLEGKYELPSPSKTEMLGEKKQQEIEELGQNDDEWLRNIALSIMFLLLVIACYIVISALVF